MSEATKVYQSFETIGSKCNAWVPASELEDAREISGGHWQAYMDTKAELEKAVYWQDCIRKCAEYSGNMKLSKAIERADDATESKR